MAAPVSAGVRELRRCGCLDSVWPGTVHAVPAGMSQTISLESLASVTGVVYWSRATHRLWNQYYSAPAGPMKSMLYQKYLTSADQGLLGTIFKPIK